MTREPRLRLQDMLVHARKAVSILGDATFEQLSADDLQQLALARCLEIVGEAGKHVPTELKAANPQVSFSSAARMRDRLIHAYFSVETRFIYDTVRDDLPALIHALEALLSKLEHP